MKEGTWHLKMKKKELGRRQENKGRADRATQPNHLNVNYSGINLSSNGVVSQSLIISPDRQHS